MDAYAPNKKVLYVDDEENLLSSFSSLMRREGYHIQTLSDSLSIGTVLERDGPFALVISDQRMPGLDGVGVLKKVKESHAETIRILLTGFASLEDTQRAINESGIARYLNKPWDDEALKQLVRECVDQFNLISENKYLTLRLARQNAALTDMLDGTVAQSIRLLSNLLFYINPGAANQTERVRKLGRLMLDMVPGVSAEERWDVERALDLFNIGIAMLPPLVQVSLNKDGLHTIDRFPLAANHFIVAADLLKDVPQFSGVAEIIRLQAKNYDGSGKPEADQTMGNNIPLGARLLHILLDLEKMSTPNFRGKDVLKGMLKRKGIYDTGLIDLMLNGSVSPKGGRKEQDITLFHIAPGMTLLEDIRTQLGMVLLQKNTMLTEASVKILQQWNGYDRIVEPIRIVTAEQ